MRRVGGLHSTPANSTHVLTACGPIKCRVSPTVVQERHWRLQSLDKRHLDYQEYCRQRAIASVAMDTVKHL